MQISFVYSKNAPLKRVVFGQNGSGRDDAKSDEITFALKLQEKSHNHFPFFHSFLFL